MVRFMDRTRLFDNGMTDQEPLEIARERDAALAPYAVKDAVGFGRITPETLKPNEHRTRFLIDLGRAKHSNQIRALFGKTQVYPSTVFEGVLNRGTHSGEVEYQSESIGRALGLNTDLLRVSGLFHDAGHPPFGHEGETALRHWAEMHGLTFEHNDQLMRIVTRLAERGDKRGMNFSLETLRALDKHGTWFGWEKPEGNKPLPYSFLEAQVVNIADAIAYFSGDAQDALTYGTITREKLKESPLFAEAMEMAGADTDMRSEVIQLLAFDLITETRKKIEDLHITSLEDVLNANEPIVRFSPRVTQQVDEVKKFMYANMYRSSAKIPYRAAVNHLINPLCCWLHGQPNEAVLEYERFSDYEDPNSRRVQAVLDYVSALRDRDAIAWGKENIVEEETINLLSQVFGKTTDDVA